MTSLVIVESEQKAKSLQDHTDAAHETLILNSVPMQVRHDPSESKLHTGEKGFQFVPVEKAKDFTSALLAGLRKDIYLALDSDTRGEFWSWMITKFLSGASTEAVAVRRVHVPGYIAGELEECFRHVVPVQDDAAASFYIRSLFNSVLVRHLKRLLGTTTGPGGLQLHYTSLTTLFLLEERQAEITSFSAPSKWHIKLRMSGPAGEFMSELREAYLITENGFLKDSAQVKEALALFEGQPFAVKKVEKSDFILEAPSPYRLAELVADGYTLLGMGPGKVLRALKKFYAGVQVKRKSTGLISSPFSLNFLDLERSLGLLRQEVETVYGKEELVERELEGQVVLPLAPGLSADDLQDSLSREEGQLYELIRCRALASQMVEASGQNIEMVSEAGKCLFVARNPSLSEKGFLAVYQSGYDPELLHPCPLNGLETGQEIKAEQIIPEQMGNRGAEYYTFDSLLDDLDDFSTPVEASLLVTLQQMLDKGYLTIDADGCFHCQQNAGKVISTLNRAFPGMKGINLSAYFEQTVAEAVSGRKSLDFALKQFDQNFIMYGVPLVKIRLPKSVPTRLKRSKNIIKSPEPEKVQPLHGNNGVLGKIESPAAPKEVLEVKGPLDVVEDHAPPEDVLGVEAPIRDSDGGQIESETVPDVDAAMEETDVGAENGSAEEAQAELELGQVPDEADGVPSLSESDNEMTAEEAQPHPSDPDIDEEPRLEKEREAVFEEPVKEPEPAKELAVQAPADKEHVKPCPDCGRPLLLKNDQFGKYWSCSGYPACRHSETYGREQEKLNQLCPLCHKEEIAVKRTPAGKKLYVCPGRECEFMAWSQPHGIGCPSCASPFLVEKKKAGGRMVLCCPRAGCSYQQRFSGGSDSGDMAGNDAPKKKKILVRRKKGSSGGSGKKRRVVVRRKK